MSGEIEQIYGFTYTDFEGKEYSKTIKTFVGTYAALVIGELVF